MRTTATSIASRMKRAFSHFADRDHLHERAALRPDFDQPDLGELDEGLAHRLARDAELPGDFGLD